MDTSTKMDRMGDGVSDGADRVEREGRRAARSDWVETMARFGYAAKGIVYFLVGALTVWALVSAVQIAGNGGQAGTGSKGALRFLDNQPAGTALLVAIGVGLLGYVLWKAIEFFLDPENKSARDWGWARRALTGVSAILYASLAVYAFSIAFGSGGGGGGGGADSWTAQVMQWPAGRWLVGIAGLIIAGYGVVEFWRGYKETYMDKLNTFEMSAEERETAEWTGRFGLWGRGVVFVIIGFFVVVAAVQFDPSEARGLRGAMETLLAQPYGPWLMGIVAVGLAAYGIFTLLKAKYRVIRNEAA